jgi:hypothetical protein
MPSSHAPRAEEGQGKGRAEEGAGKMASKAPDIERLHGREARQTGGERGGAVGADVIPAAGERE